MSRGFDSTLGVGSTDKITLGSLTADLTSPFALVIASWRNDEGGNGQGLMWGRNEGTFTGAFFINGGLGGGSTYIFSVPFTSGANQWRFSRPATGGWHINVVKYDPSSPSNDPKIWMDGTLQTVVQHGTEATGSATSNTSAHLLGNRGANDLVWDGKLGHFAWFTTPPSDADCLAISAGTLNPQSASGVLDTYIPYSGTTTAATVGSAHTAMTGTAGLAGDDASMAAAGGGGGGQVKRLRQLTGGILTPTGGI